MAWQIPKTDWKAGDAPSSGDFNRIEGNIEELNNPLYGVTSGTANNYVVSVDGIRGYNPGLRIAVKIHVASTGASTINVNGLGAKAIKKPNGNNATNLKANGVYTLVYDGTNFILQGEGGEGNAQPGDVIKGKIFTNDDDVQTGTLELAGTATTAKVLSPYTFYNTDPKTKQTGSIVPKVGTRILPKTNHSVTIPQGYYDYDNVINKMNDNVSMNSGTVSVSTGSGTKTIVSNVKSTYGYTEIHFIAVTLSFTIYNMRYQSSIVNVVDYRYQPGNYVGIFIRDESGGTPYSDAVIISIDYDDSTDDFTMDISNNGDLDIDQSSLEVDWEIIGIK